MRFIQALPLIWKLPKSPFLVNSWEPPPPKQKWEGAHYDNIDQVPLINPSATVFVVGDFSIHDKDWLTYSGGTDRPDKLCYNFSISNDLTQISDCDSYSLALLHLFLLTLVFVLQWLSLHWDILIMLLYQFPLTFCQTQNGMSPLTGMILLIWVFLLLLVNFVSGFRLELM